MRTKELIKLMPSQYRRATENPLYSGHHIPELGYWTETEGFVKGSTMEYDGLVLPCPIIAVIDEKIGNKDLVLHITTKQSQYKETTETTQFDNTLVRKVYEDAGTTLETDFTIPRFTRRYATFLLTSLGRMSWDIESITTVTENCVGKVSFYALASNGSKIIFWFGMYKLAEEIKEILRPWIAPTKCSRCSGTGIEPDSDPEIDCLQCGGYKYSGYSSTKSVQRLLAYDLGLTRDVLDWDDLDDDDHDLIFKFINKAWTQKWWCTPTVSEIKRLFAHFYNLPTTNIFIYENFDPQEPVWEIYLPEAGGIKGSPFATTTEEDRILMRYIARSITPAGVSVFVGFYTSDFLGDFEGLTDKVYVNPYQFVIPKTSMEHQYDLWGVPRWDFYNGWCHATDNFEREGALGWTSGGTVEIVNVNDMNRHMCKFTDNSYITSGQECQDGELELWVHPVDTQIKIGVMDETGTGWFFYTYYDPGNSGWYDNSDNLLTKAMPDCDYHVSMVFDIPSGLFDIRINDVFSVNSIGMLGTGSVSDILIKIESIGTGYGFIDDVGLPDDVNYHMGDNWERLYPYGYGIDNEDFATGVTGTVYDLMETYFRKNRFFDLNI